MSESKHTPLTAWQRAALECLDHATRRDSLKGGGGMRTSTEVAEYVGITSNQARSVLYALTEYGLADCFDERPLVWRITDAGRTHPILAEAEGR